MKINPLSCALLLILVSCHSLSSSKISKKDLKKDVELVTTEGVIVLRLYDDTPLSRSNFLKLAKTGMYDSIQFHRVIEKFMIQAGERVHEESFKKKKELYGFEDLVPAEISAGHFHKRGALAAAREGDDSNPKQQGSFIQFYIVHGRTYTDSTLDLTEKRINKSLAYNQVINDPANASTFTTYQNLIKNRSGNNQEAIKKLKSELDSLTERRLETMALYSFPESHREVYKTVGGAAHLDQNYTVFGEVVTGMDVVDKIAAVETGDRNKPVNDVLILSTRLVDR